MLASTKIERLHGDCIAIVFDPRVRRGDRAFCGSYAAANERIGAAAKVIRQCTRDEKSLHLSRGAARTESAGP